jgi:hypothetical protein
MAICGFIGSGFVYIGLLSSSRWAFDVDLTWRFAGGGGVCWAWGLGVLSSAVN